MGFRASCHTSEDVFWKLYALRNFIHDLRWPQDEFNQHLNFRLMILAATSIDSVVKLAIKTFHSTISSVPKNRKGLLFPKLGVMINVLTRADEVVSLIASRHELKIFFLEYSTRMVTLVELA